MPTTFFINKVKTCLRRPLEALKEVKGSTLQLSSSQAFWLSLFLLRPFLPAPPPQRPPATTLSLPSTQAHNIETCSSFKNSHQHKLQNWLSRFMLLEE
ncbi:hypothetical protein SETIT_9G254100v2 [Setaria italica]|uniref:Uncharacterized protein n=1 Tax=Setaria italica TaxID=4555 RepID=A0A368SM96_SETIT|nr:hypothetical protein SETIT_9G254100v2 [Setaria italica]